MGAEIKGQVDKFPWRTTKSTWLVSAEKGRDQGWLGRGEETALYLPGKEERCLNQSSVLVQKNKWAMEEQIQHRVGRWKLSCELLGNNDVANLPKCEIPIRKSWMGLIKGVFRLFLCLLWFCFFLFFLIFLIKSIHTGRKALSGTLDCSSSSDCKCEAQR